MTPDQLRHAVPSMPIAIAHDAAIAINAACARFDISTTLEQAHFTVQCLHESRGFMKMVESLDYKAEQLLVVWPKHFTAETARMHGRVDHTNAHPGEKLHPANPAMIANIAYAKRFGNGSIESGDGFRFRGRGPGQLTFAENYRKCGAALGLNLLQFPEQVAQIQVGTAAFGWFWSTHGCAAPARVNNLGCVRLKVNGGDLGLDACEGLLDKLLEVL
jgi:putative chitinase